MNEFIWLISGFSGGFGAGVIIMAIHFSALKQAFDGMAESYEKSAEVLNGVQETLNNNIKVLREYLETIRT